MTRKLIIHDGRSERELVLVGTLTVGRDPACHISDLDPLLSRRHAEFVSGASGCTVRDLGSRNGMLVNGLKVREQLLKEGDLVQLGHLQLRYTEDNLLTTPASVRLANATTAHEVATVAVASASALDDTRPHPPHEHAGHEDPDATRARSGSGGDDPTMAPRGSSGDADATVAARPAPAADPDETVAPRRRAPAADPDATIAPGTRQFDPDATMIAGGAAAPVAAPGMPNTDFDATGAGRPNADLAAALAGNLDATIAPGSLDLDATLVAVGSSARPAAMPPMEARLTTGADFRITAASPGCRVHFNVAPDALVGRLLGDVLAERLGRAAEDGHAELTLAVDRSPADRSLIVVLKTAQVRAAS